MEPASDVPSLTCHATAISYQNAAALLIGPSGAGKSALALQLLSLGAQLIADDQVTLTQAGDGVTLSRPAELPQAIEARGFGLLPVACAAPAPLHLVVDLAQLATDRFPEPTSCEYFGYHFEVMAKIDAAHFPATILTYLTSLERYQSGHQ